MNLFKSIMTYRCPRCRSSKLFKAPFEFSNPLNMHEQCPVCEQRFEPEPGFYFGAMFISYGLSSILLLVPALTLVLGFGWEVEPALGLVLFLAAISYFRILRLSRSIWIHINVRAEAKWKKAEREKG